jgi:hypothetical protein
MKLRSLQARHHAAIAFACLAGFAGVARAADYPPRKPGLWEMKMAVDGKAAMPAMITQQCIDAGSDQAMRELGNGMGKDACSKQDVRNEGGRITVDSVCKFGASTSTSHAVITGDFGNSYRMESRSTYNPPLGGRSEGNVVLEAKWLSPCKADQKPGDVIMSNGNKMNLLQMMGGKK